jgi:hypothetical protein
LLAVDASSSLVASNYIAAALNNSLGVDIPTIEVAASTDWRTNDPNCELPDFVIGSQTWA